LPFAAALFFGLAGRVGGGGGPAPKRCCTPRTATKQSQHITVMIMACISSKEAAVYESKMTHLSKRVLLTREQH
jgi:hypothetical protein